MGEPTKARKLRERLARNPTVDTVQDVLDHDAAIRARHEPHGFVGVEPQMLHCKICGAVLMDRRHRLPEEDQP